MKRLVLGTAFLLSFSVAANADITTGKQLSSQCTVCHGKNGIAKDPEAPNLAGQSAFYLEKALVEFKKGIRQDRRMSIIAQGLEMDQIRALAEYYSAYQIEVTPPEL